MDLIKIEKDVRQITLELLDAAKLRPYEALVVGGSTSEIAGQKLGSATNLEVAKIVVGTIVSILKEHRIYPIIQGLSLIHI